MANSYATYVMTEKNSHEYMLKIAESGKLWILLKFDLLQIIFVCIFLPNSGS